MKLPNLILFLGTFVLCQCFSGRENNFTTEFLYNTQTETGGHAAVSSYGAWNILSLNYLMTAGDTSKELQRALFLPKGCIDVIYGLKNLSDVILASEPEKSTVVSRNYMLIDINVSEHYPNIISEAKLLGIKVIQLDLREQNSAAKVANTIMYDEGRNFSIHVPDLIKPNEVHRHGITFANVNMFQRVWLNKFTSINVEDFYNSKGNPIGKVNMMFQRVNALYAHIVPLKSQVIELPFQDDGRYSMLLIRPDQMVTVDDVFEQMTKLTYKQILNILNLQSNRVVAVKLPRFKINTNYALNIPLNKMGVYDLFDRRSANFHNVDPNTLFVPAIVQHVNMEVDEIGLLTSTFKEAQTKAIFYANRPFLYFVIEKTTDTIVISGVYSKPTVS